MPSAQAPASATTLRRVERSSGDLASAAIRRMEASHEWYRALSAEDRSWVGLVAQAGITVISLPPVNQYLQDRMPHRTPRWRGVTLLHELRARGITVLIGGDNCRDPFYGYGDHDPMETFTDSVRIGHLDKPFGDWPAAIAAHPGVDTVAARRRIADAVIRAGRHLF